MATAEPLGDAVKPIDMAELRRTIEAAPLDGAAAGVSRAWLEQVERELREGRAARAMLSAHQGVADVTADLERRIAAR